MQHEAIYALYNNVVSIIGVGSDAVAKDNKGNLVCWDATKVSAKQKAIQEADDLRLLRVERNNKLTLSDWTQSRDVTLSNDADWKTYRQALRDITKTYKTLDDVKWPEEPS